MYYNCQSDEEIVKKAKEFNINMSTFLEVKLVEYLTKRDECSRRALAPTSINPLDYLF